MTNTTLSIGPLTPCYEVYELKDGRFLVLLDDKRIHWGTLPHRRSVQNQIQYDIGQRARDPNWYRAIGRTHSGCDHCWR